MRVYFIRHAESVANAENIITSRAVELYPLTERGESQATTLAEQLREVEFTAAYSSHLLRAVQTAEIILDGRDIPLQQDRLLREHDSGELEDRKDDQAWQELEETFQAWIGGDFEARPAGGESLLELQARFRQFLKQLESPGNPTGSTVLVVSHAGTFWGNLPFLFENVDFTFAREHGIDNAVVIVGEYDGSIWRCLSWDGYKL